MVLPDTFIALTVDVEWAHEEVLKDLIEAIDERELRATFFCTHSGIDVGPHERALHPNLRWSGDLVRAALSVSPGSANEDEVCLDVLRRTLAFCPEAIGTRGHHLRNDTSLLRHCAALGLQYDSSYLMTMQTALSPFRLPFGLVEFPIYFMDHLDLIENETEFRASSLRLGSVGMKVLAFHPNMVFANAPDDGFYQRLRPSYKEPTILRRERFHGRGVRDLFLETLDELASLDIPVLTLSEAHAHFE